MEHGFYHPDLGYWQVIGNLPEKLPKGTVKVPARPSGNHQWRDGAWVLVPRPVTSEQVDAERDRRLVSGFPFPSPDGDVWQFQSDDQSTKRITGAATLAGFAMGAGAGAGDYLWHSGTTPFRWILADNRIVEIDAPTMFAVGQAAAKWESAHIFAAKALKDADPIPANFADDKRWP